MNVAPATAAAQKPLVLMTARNGDAVEKGADTRTPPATDKADPLVGRYPVIAFSFDTDAERLVMLFRDPADGSTVSQIPTKAALKQYKEAQKAEKEGRASMGMLVGGDGADGEGGESKGAGHAGAPARGDAATSAHVASMAPSAVSSFSAAVVRTAASGASGSGASGSGSVNVVI